MHEKRKKTEKTRYLSKKMGIVAEKLLDLLYGMSPEQLEKYEDMKEKAIEIKRDGFSDVEIIGETGVYMGGEV